MTYWRKNEKYILYTSSIWQHHRISNDFVCNCLSFFVSADVVSTKSIPSLSLMSSSTQWFSSTTALDEISLFPKRQRWILSLWIQFCCVNRTHYFFNSCRDVVYSRVLFFLLLQAYISYRLGVQKYRHQWNNENDEDNRMIRTFLTQIFFLDVYFTLRYLVQKKKKG